MRLCERLSVLFSLLTWAFFIYFFFGTLLGTVLPAFWLIYVVLGRKRHV